MTQFERIKALSKEDLAKELMLVANWDKKQKAIMKRNNKNELDWYVNWLESEATNG